MNENYPSLNEWKRLYEVALEFREIGCWEWMTDDYIFGVQNPETDEIGYCCVIGNLGEVFGLIVYTGSKGLASYLKIITLQNPEGNFDNMLLQECLSITFEDRRYLEKEDLKVIKDLGFKFRGRNAYPLFRNLKPGYYPWFITREEARFLIVVFQQALDVCQRFKYDKTLLIPPVKGQYFVRVPQIIEGGLSWRDEWMWPQPLQPEEFTPIRADELRLQRIKSNAVQQGIWEFDYFYANMPVKEEGRPYFPMTLLIVDSASGFILHARVSTPLKYQREFTDSFISFVEEAGILPKELLVAKDEAMKILEPVISCLKIKLTKVKRCKEVEKAQRSFSRFTSRR
ncbi:MAG: hypothetical protein AB1480_14560 [Nitrospirota bacterium]